MQSPTDTPFPGQSSDGEAQATERVRQMGHKAADVIEEKREAVARGIESAADYVRDQDLQTMLSDARQLVKRHPGAVLLTAVTLGFLLARSFTRH